MTALLGILLLAAVVWGLAQRWQNRRLLQRLNAMLDDALQGQFSAQHYDEDLLSAVETRMAQLLATNELDRRELAAEKERVKSLIGDISHPKRPQPIWFCTRSFWQNRIFRRKAGSLRKAPPHRRKSCGF